MHPPIQISNPNMNKVMINWNTHCTYLVNVSYLDSETLIKQLFSHRTYLKHIEKSTKIIGRL